MTYIMIENPLLWMVVHYYVLIISQSVENKYLLIEMYNYIYLK
jgi:hypothetical protein